MTKTADGADGDARLAQALGEFRESVCAWSEAAMPRAAAIEPEPHGTAWRRTLAWALGVVLAAGAVSGSLVERHHRQVLAQEARQLEMAREQALAAQRRAIDVDDLLANVDRDISREVPDALEPLAQMMAEDGSGK